MKFKYEETSLEVLKSADMKEMDFGIKACDVGFIIQLLRNDMYRYPIDAICREIASNSRDANREVCCGDSPIEIVMSKNPYLETETSISFIDQGPGISPERMADVFLNYGASTKRETDEQTGGFGLGAKTPFAYTNTFCIETVHDCTKYVYVAMVKSGNKGRMYLLDESECFEEAGTTVSVPIKQEDIDAFEHAAYRATYFWDVRPIYRNFTTLREVNDYDTIIETDDYLVVMETKRGHGVSFVKNSRVAVLLDGIPYEIDNTVDFVYATNRLLENLPAESRALVFAKLKTGEVSISPSRESLQYNDKTIEKLKKCMGDISAILDEESRALVARTGTVVERVVLKQLLGSSYGFDLRRHMEIRPFSNYTLGELIKMYFGIRFVDIIKGDKNKSDFLKEYDDIPLSQDFRVLFPGLSLREVSFEKNVKTKCGVRCKTSNAKVSSAFYGRAIYLQDIPKRTSARERTHYKAHGTDMFVIVPDDCYFTYSTMDLEGKGRYRKTYCQAKRSIRRLKELGIDHYSLYSELKNDVPKREKGSSRKRMGVSFKWLSGDYAYSDYLVGIKGKDLELESEKEMKVETVAYYAVNDLRCVKDNSEDFDIVLFHILCKIRGVGQRVVFINHKSAPTVVGKIASVKYVVSKMTDEEKIEIGNLLTVAGIGNKYDKSTIEDYEFYSREFSLTMTKWLAAKKKYGKLLGHNGRVEGHRVNGEEFDKYRDLSPLKILIPILERINEAFPLLQHLKYSGCKKDVQEYISLMEQKMIKEGELHEPPAEAQVD